MVEIINGKEIAQNLKQELSYKLEKLQKKGDRAPCLCVVLVGDDPASRVYVAHKEKACKKIGIISKTVHLEASSSEEKVLGLIKELNKDPVVDSILVQLPLPPQINSWQVIQAINPLKDVDGLTPQSQGLLAWGKKGFIPCTPLGILKLLESLNQDLEGKKVAIIGRSVLVGASLARLLTQRDMTVSLLHSRSKNPKKITTEADIVIAAAGVRKLVDASWLKEGAIAIDVGIHRQEDGSLVGDIDFDSAATKARWMTPVPGGVGPMTIACLLANCVEAYENKLYIRGVQVS